MNLAFVRIPKTGTTSLAYNFSQNIQHRELYPCLMTGHTTTGEYSLHGHSHDFISIVRDPLQMYCSMYYFIKNRIHKNAVDGSPIDSAKSVLSEAIVVAQSVGSLEEFLLNAPENYGIAKYFGDVDPNQFLVIGETNLMSETLALITAVTGIPTQDVWKNKNPARPTTLQPYYVDNGILQEFQNRNALEYQLYYQSKEHFNNLRSRWL